ncbi:MAG: septum formation inhibitor Maf [Betaproteobacteria bacterium]|nr:MAG: septum formation inhibitor Maf [Betaproteobacteria bacterium]
MSQRIYLASRSPRRRELLKQIGVSYEMLLLREDAGRSVDVDETPLPGEAPRDYVLRITQDKAETGWQRLIQRRLPRMAVLAADTAVVLGERIMGKPADSAAAAEMLSALSGREHQVLTAVALAFDQRLAMRLSVSTVSFRNLSADEIRRYILSGEPLDKAGAYAIQGRAAAFVASLGGSYSGVMGLPLFETTQLLMEFGMEII